MKIKLSVRQKIITFVLGTSVVLFAITIGFFSITSKQEAYKNTTELASSYTDHYATMVESWLNSDMAVVRTLSSSLAEHRRLPFEQWRELMMGMYGQVMYTNPQIDAIWDSWEMNYLDPNWGKPHGRWLHIYYRERGRLLSKYEMRSIDGDPANYAALKAAGRESIAEPYLSKLQTGGLMTSLTSPIHVSGRFAGVVGVDIFLGRFQTLICGVKPFDESFAFLITSQGTFVAHPDSSIYSKNIESVYPDLSQNQRIISRIKRAEKFSFSHTLQNGERLVYSFSPVVVGNTQLPWAFGIVVPERSLLKSANRNFNIGVAVGVVGVFILVITIVFLARSITKPMGQITYLLDELAKGKVDKSLRANIDSGDEIAKMGESLTNTIDGLLTKVEFAREIGEGKLDTYLKLLSDEDVLGKSLIEMRKSLKKAKAEEAKRIEEDKITQWTNEGLAKFNDILRQNNDNLSKLGDELIKNLVWYLNASLGGVFINNDDEEYPVYELTSAFAYDRKRYLQKKFEKGEGLIGSCAVEANTVYLEVVPQEYIEVTSGLGDTKPNSVLIIPLIIDEEVLGIIEMASLHKFKDYEIKFVEKLAESIATTLRSVKINQKTAELLRHSQEQTEIMQAQEEEMRQNLEELQATQEEATRKTIEMEGLIQALNASAYVIEYDVRGTIININDSYLELLGITKEETVGRHHSENLVMTEQQRLHYEEFWNNLRRGLVQKQTMQINIMGRNFTFLETYTPIKNASGDVYKILKVANDITATIKK
jgi:methyl-accepting chemotaxis protein